MDRTAIELEKKTHHSNLEHSKVMERNNNVLAHEIEKLHSKLIDAEKRARSSSAGAVTANAGICFKFFCSQIVTQSIKNAAPLFPFCSLDPGHGLNYGNSEIGFGGSPFLDPYAMHQVCFDC